MLIPKIFQKQILISINPHIVPLKIYIFVLISPKRILKVTLDSSKPYSIEIRFIAAQFLTKENF